MIDDIDPTPVPTSPQVLRGPFTWLALAVALGWVALAGASLVLLSGPVSLAAALGCVVAAALTAWIAATLGVTVDADGVRVGRGGVTAWADVSSVDVRSGVLSVPVLSVRQGRALADVPLEGLAWWGRSSALATGLAQRIADAGDLGAVGVRGGTTAVGRRAVRDDG